MIKYFAQLAVSAALKNDLSQALFLKKAKLVKKQIS
jgi:hypothetical protein